MLNQKLVNGKKIKNRKWECDINGIYFGDEYNESLIKKYERRNRKKGEMKII